MDHYLEVLARKPGAMPGATALAQARAAGSFTPAHDAFWAMARSKLCDGASTRVMVEVLLLHRHLPAADVEARLTAALRLQTRSSDVVALEARKADGQPHAGPVPFLPRPEASGADRPRPARPARPPRRRPPVRPAATANGPPVRPAPHPNHHNGSAGHVMKDQTW